MPRSDNFVHIRGNLGTDPEVHYFGNGDRVVKLRVATNLRWTTPSGEQQERTDWHSVDVLGQAREYCQTRLRRGDLVAVMGTLRHDVVPDKAGGANRVYTRIRSYDVTGLGAASVRFDTAAPEASSPASSSAAAREGRSASASPDSAPPQAPPPAEPVVEKPSF